MIKDQGKEIVGMIRAKELFACCIHPWFNLNGGRRAALLLCLFSFLLLFFLRANG
jgi:hypothetical protein